VHQSDLSVVSRHFYFLHFVHQSHICRFYSFLYLAFCPPKSFIFRFRHFISYILSNKVIYLSFLDISISYILYTSHLSFVLDISISYILYTKVIYLSFLDIFISYILHTKVFYLSFLDISISYILYPKVIYLSFLDISISYILYIKFIYCTF
jgi:hypothetical protein